MLQWMFYVLVVTVLFAASGWVVEKALRRRALQTRWGWAAAIGLTLLLSYVTLPVSIAPRAHQPTVIHSAWKTVQHIAPVALPTLQPKPATASAYASRARWNALTIGIWRWLSILAAVALLFNGVYVWRLRRRWPMQLVGSHCVGVSRDTGPAVIGLLNPTIVIPLWVLEQPALDQQLILAHEASHLQARDPLLLTAALAALILVPWNIALWWQLYRLRHAIEVDCDARVLNSGHDLKAYGEALIEVGSRRGAFIGAVAAMAESRTLLERRIEVMATRTRRRWTYGFALTSILAFAIAAAATQVTAPTNGSGASQEISMDVPTLERYVGNYKLGDVVLAITLDGSQLSEQVTGSPKLPIFARSPNEFFVKGAPLQVLQITFDTSQDGPSKSATFQALGQNVVAPRLDDAAAQAIATHLAERFAQQQPQEGSEAALRRSLEAIEQNAPNYDEMGPGLQRLAREQWPTIQAMAKERGPLASVQFRGVTQTGLDKYQVTYQNGKQTTWIIKLNDNGTIGTLGPLPTY
jgi:bla regulator protein BlaR1